MSAVYLTTLCTVMVEYATKFAMPIASNCSYSEDTFHVDGSGYHKYKATLQLPYFFD